MHNRAKQFIKIQSSCPNLEHIKMINNKARHNLLDEKCRWRSHRLDGAVSFWKPLGQTKVIQIRQGETQNHQGVITHEVCCLAAQLRLFISQKFAIISIHTIFTIKA